MDNPVRKIQTASPARAHRRRCVIPVAGLLFASCVGCVFAVSPRLSDSGAESAPPAASVTKPRASDGLTPATGINSATAAQPSGSGVPASLAESEGYRLLAAVGVSEAAGAEDYAPPVFYEVLPPTGKKARIGRVYISCTCLKAERVDGAENGRALVRLRKRSPPPDLGDGFLLMVWLDEPEGLLLQCVVSK